MSASNENNKRSDDIEEDQPSQPLPSSFHVSSIQSTAAAGNEVEANIPVAAATGRVEIIDNNDIGTAKPDNDNNKQTGRVE